MELITRGELRLQGQCSFGRIPSSSWVEPSDTGQTCKHLPGNGTGCSGCLGSRLLLGRRQRSIFSLRLSSKVLCGAEVCGSASPSVLLRGVRSAWAALGVTDCTWGMATGRGPACERAHALERTTPGVPRTPACAGSHLSAQSSLANSCPFRPLPGSLVSAPALPRAACSVPAPHAWAVSCGFRPLSAALQPCAGSGKAACLLQQPAH